MRHLVLAAAMVTWMGATVAAQDAEAYLHKAYYLETREGRIAEAAELYEKVLQDRELSEELRRTAERRLAGCRERLRSADLLALLPKGAIGYVEVREPGLHLSRIVERVGLTREDIAPGALPFGISPRLLEALREGERAALALMDFSDDVPQGVIVFDAGTNDLAFGTLDTMLSGAAAAGEIDYGEPIHGHTTYQARPIGTVAVTERLIVAGHPRVHVAHVIEQLQGEDPPSVSERLGALGAERETALAFAMVDGERLIGRLKEEVTRHGRVPEELTILQAFADIDSIQFAAARLSTDDQGLEGDLIIELAEGNHAVAYHLLRTPPVSDDALAAVPADAVAVAAFRLSENEGLGAVRTMAAWQATGLDIGREIFGNIDDAVVFIVPPAADAAGRHPVPDLGIVLDVKDARRSEALWSELLRVGATLARENPDVVESREIAGRAARVYRLPDDMALYFCALEDRIVLGVTEHALERAIAVAGGEPSLLDSDRFREIVLSRDGASKIVAVDIGRVLETLGPVLRIPTREAAQIREVVGDSIVLLSTTESASSLRGSIRLGWPRIGPWVREMLSRERGGHESRRVATERRTARRRQRGSRGNRAPRAPVPKVDTPAASSVRQESPELVKQLIPLGAVWSYFDQGTDPGKDWSRAASTPDGWKKGPAPLGYGEEALATVVSFGENPRQKHATTFFRSTFTVEHPEQFDALRLHVRRDDGVAVYINGKQVARNNLGRRASWRDYSGRIVGGEDEKRYLRLRLDSGVVCPGKNVIAVEIHQANPVSSDIVFDLGLEGLRRRDTPKVEPSRKRSRQF